MPSYDFSTILHARTGKPLSCLSLHLAVPGDGVFDAPSDYERALPVGELLEITCLYTVDRRPSDDPETPRRFLTETEKRARYAIALKIRDCKVTEITAAEVEVLRKAITIFSTEPNGLLHAFLDAPIP